MALKPGSVADFDNSMAEAIEQAMQDEWQEVKGVELPSQGEVDRRLLFVAVARGVLRYLKTHENEVLTSITTKNDVSGSTEDRRLVTRLEINA